MQHFLQTRLLPGTVTAAALALITGVFSPADAASFSFSVSPFTGSPAKVNLTLDDTAAGAGKVQFKVDVDQSISLADLRGVFFNIQDDSLLSGLNISGANVTQFVKTGNVIEVGGGNNLNGGGMTGFDVGVEIGREGLKGGQDDIRSTVFTVSHSSRALDLRQFSSQSFGVRVTSVGTGNNREGSSKLSGTAPTLPPVTQPPVTQPPVTQPPVTQPPVNQPPVTQPPVTQPPVTQPPVTQPPVTQPPVTPTLPPVVIVSPPPKPPAKVPEPGMTVAIVLTAIGGMKLVKRKSGQISVQQEVEA